MMENLEKNVYKLLHLILVQEKFYDMVYQTKVILSLKHQYLNSLFYLFIFSSLRVFNCNNITILRKKKKKRKMKHFKMGFFFFLM